MSVIRVPKDQVEARRRYRKERMDLCEMPSLPRNRRREPTTDRIMRTNRGPTYTYA